MAAASDKRDLKPTEPFWKSREPARAEDPPRPQPASEPQPALRNETDARTLIVGAGMSISGAISACDRLIAEGTVDAKLDGCQHLLVAKSGIFRGNVTTDHAEIHGRVEGDLVVRKRLLVRATGQVSGTIAYGDIEIECGGKISGQFKPQEGGNAETHAKPAQPGLDYVPLGQQPAKSAAPLTAHTPEAAPLAVGAAD
jgi:cytoskeletal protein CcmA (bactofilin family)